jgi:hypothetical protein
VDLYLSTYLATAAELSGACLVLAQSGETVGIPILVRSLLKARVDFECLLRDDNYPLNIEALHDKEWGLRSSGKRSTTEKMHT